MFGFFVYRVSQKSGVLVSNFDFERHVAFQSKDLPYFGSSPIIDVMMSCGGVTR